MEPTVISTGIRYSSLPESYIPPESDRHNLSQVPIIDIGCPDRSLIIQQIGDAIDQYGFFQVINHGVAKEVLEKMQEVGGEFFRLPVEEKMKLYSDDPSKTMRLSTSFNVKKEKIHNWRDYLRLHCHPLEQYAPEWPSSFSGHGGPSLDVANMKGRLNIHGVDPLYVIYLISSKDGNGDDANMSLAYPVFHALREKGHPTYKYGHDIESKDVLLLQQLKCCIIFFSKNYVSSRCYLDELVKIAHRFSTSPHRILSVYFNLDKSDIRNQLGILREVFYEYEREIDDEMDYQRKRKLMCDVEKRRAALKQIVDHSLGFHFPNRSESKEDLNKRIVLEAERTVKRRDFKHPPKPIGIDRRAKPLQFWVDN